MPAERAGWLLVLLFPGLAFAQVITRPAADGKERSWGLEVRAGAGVDSNVLHDPRASRQSALARVDVTAEVEPTRELRLSLLGWFDQHLPSYDLNEASAQLLLLFRRPIYKQLYIRLGSFGDYHRELSTFFEGTVYTHGAFLLSEVGEHVSLGLEQRIGPFDLEIGTQGHVKDVQGSQAFTVFGVDGNVAVRFVPNRFFSLRLRYLFLFEDVRGLVLLGLNGMPTPVRRDLQLSTHQVDATLHLRPIASLDLFARYEFGAIDDDFVGYLYGQEHRVIGGLRYDDEKRWVVDLQGKMVLRRYPLRDPSLDNQISDLPFEVIADVELRLHKNWGLFARYQLDGEAADPFGLIYLRHAGLVGVAARAGGRW